MKKIKQAIVLATAIMGLAGCGADPQPDAGADGEPDRPMVSLIMKSLANEFFVNMAEGARDHQRLHEGQYDLIVNGLKDESDLTQQVTLVEQMMARRVDVIVIAPADSKALIPVLKRAVDEGIVVVNIDNKLDDTLLTQAGLNIPFVGPDNREGARLAGDHLAAKLKPADSVAIIGGISTAFNAQQRQLGFEDAMAAAGINVLDVQAGDWEQAKASTVASALISEHPDLKALLCANDNMAIGALAAVRQSGKTGDVMVVGFDNIGATHELLRSGELLATVDQYGDKLAIFGIEFALNVLNNGIVPADRKTPVTLITATTL